MAKLPNDGETSEPLTPLASPLSGLFRRRASLPPGRPTETDRRPRGINRA